MNRKKMMLLKAIDEMQRNIGKKTFDKKYNNFI